MDEWPRETNGDVLECIHFMNIDNITFTSSGVGTLDGQGATWWGFPGIGYLVRGENRPRLFNVEDSKNILVENIFFLNSPYWTFWVHGVDGLEVRYCEIRFVILFILLMSQSFIDFQCKADGRGPPRHHRHHSLQHGRLRCDGEECVDTRL